MEVETKKKMKTTFKKNPNINKSIVSEMDNMDLNKIKEAM